MRLFRRIISNKSLAKLYPNFKSNQSITSTYTHNLTKKLFVSESKNIILKIMQKEENKRIVQGTEHSIQRVEGHIGGNFVKTKSADFLTARQQFWDSLYQKQTEYMKTLPREKINLTLKDGKVVEATSFETSPLDIAKKYLKKSLVPDFLAAKVRYSRKVLSNDDIITGADEEEEVKREDKSEMWDLSRPLEGDCTLEFCTFEDKEGKTVFWHSSAHVLGSALENSFGSYLCIGPPLEEGFYYDSFMGKNVIEESTDYQILEDSAKQITSANHPYQRLTLSKAEALEMFKHNPFKVQLISNKVPDNGKTTAYRCGNLIDLCMGPHLISTGVVKSFKVVKNSACYWLGNAQNDSLQRVYAVTFPSEKEMKEYVKRKEEEEKRDHRNIGKQQDLFMFHNLSPGSAFFYPPGAHIYNKLVSFVRKEYLIRGFTEVVSPNIFNLRLWKTSGHYKNYKENMFMVKIENQGFGLKPMNCPGHCLMFDSKARSYKELPIRFADFGVLHRNEISGALSGLTRVRRFQQDDAHIFCAPEQIMEEILGQLEFLEYVYSIFGFEYELFLSTRPEKALGDIELWDQAEKSLAAALDKFGKPWKINPGDGAFYGPKIDIKLYDAIKRQHQCGTIQLDFQLPIRFNLSYRTDEVVKSEKEEKDVQKEVKKKAKKVKKGDQTETKQENADAHNLPSKENDNIVLEHKHEECIRSLLKSEVYQKDEWDDEEFVWEEQTLRAGYKRPVIVHRAILGSCERLLAILTEHYAGKWPFWLSPRQCTICTVSDTFNPYAEKIYQKLKYEGYQVTLDKGGATLPKKVRNAQVEQYNYILVVGEEEMNTNTIDVRSREGERLGKYTTQKLLEFFKSLEPAKSKLELQMLESIFKEQENLPVNSHSSELSFFEEKLKFNLYLAGDEIGEEDKKVYETLKSQEIDKLTYPNLFKWKKLVSKSG
jgi:threonyl-tRNA synthetase